MPGGVFAGVRWLRVRQCVRVCATVDVKRVWLVGSSFFNLLVLDVVPVCFVGASRGWGWCCLWVCACCPAGRWFPHSFFFLSFF